MPEQLIENNVQIKACWFKVNKKCTLITLTATVVTSIVVFLIVYYQVSCDYDHEPIVYEESVASGHEPTRLPKKCGQRTAKSNWPWMVEIYTNDDSGRHETIALGTLVSHRKVLTSAYAIRKYKGRYLALTVGQPGTQRHIVSMKFIEHESFDFRGGINMVLLRMDKSVEFDEYTQRICLPWVHPEIPQQLTIHPSDERGNLYSSSAHLVDYRGCFEIWLSDGFDSDWESRRLHLCAKQSNSSELCQTLPGSPLLGVFHDNGEDRFVQYGIKHYGDCTRGLQIYTNITFNMEWIRKSLNRNNGTQLTISV